ncbi:GldG family protein [Thermaerobacter sp. PB12/4term]|uniref:GldG family protein n=1 Tax=Thermaerobacter sp. PB12/4term TaxID=2293838 RepID=UPI000E32AAA6|nr:Gldg family protein [Thermaerobacter sp. PB12/4term]QIA26491.1 GldG family protein [Thermaerobacter sp. PB12/4term]
MAERADAHRRRVLWRGTNTAVLTVAVLALLVLANVFAARYSWRYDATAQKIYSLSPSTHQVLSELDQDVTLYGFLQSGSAEGDTLRRILELYDRNSDRIRLEVVDPEREPATARRYEVDTYNTVVVESGDDYRKIDPLSLFGYGAGGGLEIRAEQAITRALLDLTGRGGKKVYFLTGHGEGTPGGELATLGRLLEGEALAVETLNLAQKGEVPADAAVVAIAGPTRDLLEEERQRLEEYVRRGGRLLVLYGPVPNQPRLEQLERLLATVGVDAAADVVVDPERAFLGQDPLSPMPLLGSHPIVDPLQRGDLVLVLPGSRSLAPREDTQLTTTELLHTSDAAWGETDLRAQAVRQDSQDRPGPLALALAVEGELGQGTAGTGGNGQEGGAGDQEAASGTAGQGAAAESGAAEPAGGPRPVAVVVGSAAFVANDYLDRVPGNRDFVVNAVNWLVGSEERLTIRPKELASTPIVLTPGAVVGIFYGLVLGFPALVALVGLGIWWRRRHA